MVIMSADVICPCTVHFLSSYHTLAAQCGVTAQSNAVLKIRVFCDVMTSRWWLQSPVVLREHRAFTLILIAKVSGWSASSGTVSPETQNSVPEDRHL